MKILIIEDEIRASQQLQSLITKNYPNTTILDNLESVEDSVEWFKNNTPPDLVFMDIQLADGLSFEIFQQTPIDSPIIFTTAYDQYSIKAFKVNSVDYLLKPIVENDLISAVEKYKKIHGNQDPGVIDPLTINKLINNLTENKFRKRFIVKEGSSMTYVHVEDVAFFNSEDGITFLHTKGLKRYTLDMTLESVSKDIKNSDFFQINRGQIVCVDCIDKIKPYFNNRLSIQISNYPEEDFIVSRNRSTEFKAWVNQ